MVQSACRQRLKSWWLKGDAVPSNKRVAAAGAAWTVGLHLILFPMVTRLLHTRYRVADLARTVDFYTKVLGLKEVRRHKSPRGSELVFLETPGSEELIEICQYDASGPVVVGPDLTHLAFEVEDLEAFAAHAAALGYPLSDGPTTVSSGTTFAFIDAPEGYEIELIQRRPDASRLPV